MDKEMPLISVIVPVYNGQAYLRNCVESIVTQTYRNLEIIIVNDGSTDQTGRVCGELTETYDNVCVLTMQDEGVSAARNRGMDAASGEFITFVDADDRLLPEMIQRLYACMAKTGSDVTGCRFFCWRSEEEWQQVQDGHTESAAPAAAGGSGQDSVSDGRDMEDAAEIYTPHSYLKEAILCGNSRCWSKLYRREVIEKVRFQENLTIGEDMLFLVSLLASAGQLAETAYAGYGYFQNPAGAINRKFTPRYMDQITCWQMARQKVRALDPAMDAQVTALLLTGIMLTAGKLAGLRAQERHDNREYIRNCHESLKEALLVSGAFGRLSVGYRVKVAVFYCCPAGYLWLYHLQSGARRRRKYEALTDRNHDSAR